MELETKLAASYNNNSSLLFLKFNWSFTLVFCERMNTGFKSAPGPMDVPGSVREAVEEVAGEW